MSHCLQHTPSSGPKSCFQPDPESRKLYEAEEVWRRLEAKMGRRLRGTSLRERGRWVVKRREDTGLDDDTKGGMERQPSDFSVSTYLTFEPDDEATAIFNMAAPLVTSFSSTAATPWNTPCLRRETLQRTGRVTRKRSADLLAAGPSHARTASSMYRLDSHVIAALEALQEGFDSPALDEALGLDRPVRCESPRGRSWTRAGDDDTLG